MHRTLLDHSQLSVKAGHMDEPLREIQSDVDVADADAADEEAEDAMDDDDDAVVDDDIDDCAVTCVATDRASVRAAAAHEDAKGSFMVGERRGREERGTPGMTDEGGGGWGEDGGDDDDDGRWDARRCARRPTTPGTMVTG